MHSCYETAAVADAIHLVNAMTAYYGSTLEMTENGYALR
jgi:aspartyl aminopeptidase